MIDTGLKAIMSIVGFTGFFLSPVLLFWILKHFLFIRKGWWVRVLLYLACSALVDMVIYVGDMGNLPGTLFAFVAGVMVCSRGSFLQRISFTIILASLGLSFNALVDSYLLYYLDYANPLRLVLWTVVWLAVKRLAPKQEYELPKSLWALVDLLTLMPFAAMIVTVLLNVEFWSADSLRDIILLSIAFLTSFALLWAVVVLARQQKLEKERMLYQINQSYYQSLEQEQFQVRRLRHDIANHFQAMVAMPEKEMRGYLTQLIQGPAMENSVRFCENHVVNAVLAAKQQRMEQLGILYDIEVSMQEDISVGEVDLCALFANSLDNAIEACEKMATEGRWIKVKVRMDKGLFVLQVRNSTTEAVVLAAASSDEGSEGMAGKGLPMTTKPDKKRHGFGIASIKEIAGRYSGSVSIASSVQEYSITVTLPIAGRKDNCNKK